jgi:hypothetical protein
MTLRDALRASYCAAFDEVRKLSGDALIQFAEPTFDLRSELVDVGEIGDVMPALVFA